jgi:hypothetical protein
MTMAPVEFNGADAVLAATFVRSTVITTSSRFTTRNAGALLFFFGDEVFKSLEAAAFDFGTYAPFFPATGFFLFGIFSVGFCGALLRAAMFSSQLAKFYLARLCPKIL